MVLGSISSRTAPHKVYHRLHCTTMKYGSQGIIIYWLNGRYGKITPVIVTSWWGIEWSVLPGRQIKQYWRQLLLSIQFSCIVQHQPWRLVKSKCGNIFKQCRKKRKRSWVQVMITCRNHSYSTWWPGNSCKVCNPCWGWLDESSSHSMKHWQQDSHICNWVEFQKIIMSVTWVITILNYCLPYTACIM